MALEEALKTLATHKLRHCRIAEMRIFGEMEYKEIAHVLDVSAETVKKNWQFTRAWLRSQLDGRDC